MLREQAIEAVTTGGGSEGLAALQESRAAGCPFNIVLVDVHMPAMDGFEFVEQGSLSGSNGVFLMACCAHQRTATAWCRNHGVGYVMKPVIRGELCDAIAAMLGELRPQPHTAPDEYAAPRPPRSLHVLVAEDNAVNQHVVRRLLEKRGHRVTLTDNGRDAIAAWENSCFDLVLMDVQMPLMNGLEAAVEIRRREQAGGKHVPIIALTAHAMSGDRERCLASGMDAYLPKPIAAHQLDALLEELGNRSKIETPVMSTS